MDPADAAGPDPATARTTALAARRALDPAERAGMSLSVAHRLLELPELASATRVGAYTALPDEVDPATAVEHWQDSGTEVWLPRVVGSDLEFHRWRRGVPLLANRWGIGEPPGDGAPAAPSHLDALVVPCVAVDTHGTRVGFGAGYYDRALAFGRPPVVVGVAFSVQVVPRIHPQPWDQPMDVVVTDDAVHRPRPD